MNRTTFRANVGDVVVGPDLTVPRFTYTILDREVLRIEANGDIFVNGRLAANDLEVVEALRAFLTASGHLRPT